MVEEVRGLNPFILPQSPLYKAAIKAKMLKQKQAAEPSLYFNVSRVTQLLNRYNAKKWTFENLKNFPLSILTPEERQFIWYLQRNPHLFKKLAALDRQPETLSTKDIKIAAQLADNTMTLSSKDIEDLQELPPLRPNQMPHDKPPALHENEVVDFLKKLFPQGLQFEALRDVKPNFPLSSREAEIWQLLQLRSVQKILYNLTRPTNGQITPDIIRTLLSLLWNPSVLGTAPIIFLKSPPLDEDEEIDVPVAEEVTETELEEQPPPRGFRLRPKIALHASALKQMLHRISPNTDHATLAQLRTYKPQTEEEARMLDLLRQAGIFKLLSGQDHDPNDLSVEDIELALVEKTLILSDPFITLVILP
ncbi:MAG TPA: hypothetical protein V6C99_03060 [Oculatellaceae cyanobacterium]